MSFPSNVPVGQITNVPVTGLVGLGTKQGSSGANMSAIVRNASGDITSYMEGGITKTVTYNLDGTVNTLSGGGFTMTISYSGGEVSEVTYS